MRVNAVGPGYVETPPLKVTPQYILNGLESKHPLGLGQPEEVANLTTFPLSDKASYMTGAYALVDGGYTRV